MTVDEPGPEVVSREIVLVDFQTRPGVKDVGIGKLDLAAKSSQAIDDAMSSIRTMCDRVTLAVASAAKRPDEVSVEFGIKLDATAGALLARAGTEAHVTVTLTWKPQDQANSARTE